MVMLYDVDLDSGIIATLWLKGRLSMTSSGLLIEKFLRKLAVSTSGQFKQMLCPPPPTPLTSHN